MRTTRKERTRARQVSAAIDQLLREPEAPLAPLDPADAGLISAARQLARLPSLLGPADPALERHVMRRVQVQDGHQRRQPYFKVGWAVAGVVAALLLMMLLTPWGQTAVASFMAVFSLGRTEVHITPIYTPAALPETAIAASTAVQERLTLEDAQAQFPFAIPQPAFLPPGYRLQEVISYSYPDLPAWVPQPFFVEIVYGDGAGRACTLGVYPIMLGDEASISRMNLEATDIQEVQDVKINDQPGVLLRLGVDGDKATWQEVVWEQDDLVLALSATELTETDLLRIARSIR